MKFNFIFFQFFVSATLFATVENSVIPLMNELMIKDLRGKVNEDQCYLMKRSQSQERLRVMSFNMLLNYSESHLDEIDRWNNRKTRVFEYILEAKPDLIGSQELQYDQLMDVMQAIGKDYCYYGLGAEDGDKKGDIPAIFYRKDRLELINGRTFYFSETRDVIANGPYGCKNTFTFGHFRDKKTEKEFIVLNTHLAFGNIERRSYEAHNLRNFLVENNFDLPLLITGDFNTFPFRQQLDLPFYDGEDIISLIEEGNVFDSQKKALFGHFGPVSSTNFNSETKRAFEGNGEPGVILDHIFVTRNIKVLAHGIDPAKVNGHFPSDHYPVLIDINLP